jgi:7-carboxy-7-deazaguanine synthase
VLKPLQINDLFWTLQGEGRWTGRRALFVRMPFCNYDCPWCDTEYNSYKNFSEEEFVNFCKKESARFAVITGGEPTLHKDTPRVIALLKKMNFFIACETNGSFPIPEGIDFPTVSPKQFTQGKHEPFFVHNDVFSKAKEWKYVVDTHFDFAILDKHNREWAKDNKIEYSLSPEFSQMEENVKKIIAYIQIHPHWKLSLQTHKWINIP